MSFARTVELTSGVATGLLGISVALTFFKFDLDVSRQLEKEFHPLSELMLWLVLFIGPGLLVATGAYFHAVLRDAGVGRVMILFGSAFIVAFFLLFEIYTGYAAMAAIGLRFGTVISTLVTTVASFATHKPR
jgi:hypothetical protein